MRLLLLFTGLAITACALAQKNIDLGEVRYDTSFNCSDSIGRRFSDRVFRIDDICDSKNDVEVRYTMFGPRGYRTLILISLKDAEWDIQQYKISSGLFGRQLVSTNYIDLDEIGLGSDRQITWMLEHLTQNRIFLLPDESELNHVPQSFDGPYFQIAYKVGDKFRRYRYYYPESQCEHYPASVEYSFMAEIVKSFRTLFN